MRKIFTVIILVASFAAASISQVIPPTKETRAIWVATVTGLDWPKTFGASDQKAELINIIQSMKNNNFNTFVFQVRSRGDLLYPSAIEPWAAALNGVLGQNPGWDPLQVAVDECHKRGMEMHAWWNFGVVSNTTTPPPSVSLPHVGTAHPTWAKAAGTQMFMDPGVPEARDYLVNLAMEMVRKYDIDAIHFDYIRYLENIPNSFDDADYATYGGGMNRSDWRRENINMFVRAVYDSIKKVKPWVKVGSTPVGNYKAGVPGVGPALYGYTDCFQDSRRWMIEKKHDYIAPQIYWALGSAYPYNVILRDWLNNSGTRHVWGGIASYKPDVYPQTELMIDTTRAQKGAGHIFFRYDNISPSNFAAVKSRYANPANIPPMPWIDSIPPGTPSKLMVTKIDDKTYKLSWDKTTSGSDGDTAKYYNIYRATSSVFNTNDDSNLFYITTNSDNSYTISYSSVPDRNYYYAVSALDRNNVESAVSNIVSVIVTGIAGLNNPSNFKLEQNYPNPFNPSTNIAYYVGSKGFVTLKIYNILGQEIRTLVNEVKDAGRYVVNFNAMNQPSGMYIYKIQVSADNKTFVDYKKMMLTK